jgi:hypothetical protein
LCFPTTSTAGRRHIHCVYTSHCTYSHNLKFEKHTAERATIHSTSFLYRLGTQQGVYESPLKIAMHSPSSIERLTAFANLARLCISSMYAEKHCAHFLNGILMGPREAGWQNLLQSPFDFSFYPKPCRSR